MTKYYPSDYEVRRFYLISFPKRWNRFCMTSARFSYVAHFLDDFLIIEPENPHMALGHIE